MAEARLLSTAQALCEATDLAMERDPAVFVIGEGVADPKAIFGTTQGLIGKYGPDRVVEMPLAENGLTGIVIGAAMAGRRPILVHQRVEFSLLAFEQIVNNAAKLCYISGGRHKVPLVMRMIVGRGWGQGPAHSQSLENLFAAIPGLKVVMPTTPAESKGLLTAAIEDDNPVMVLEHRWVHYATGPVPEGRVFLPLDGPRHTSSGKDVTIVATSFAFLEVMGTTQALAKAGIAADVFDLSVLRPLNLEPILASVHRTGRLVVVDTGWVTLGMGAEILAQVTERAFGALKAPPVRLGLAEHPTPSSRALVGGFYPGPVAVFDAALKVMGRSAEAAASARNSLLAEQTRLPIDVPNPTFRGPF